MWTHLRDIVSLLRSHSVAVVLQGLTRSARIGRNTLYTQHKNTLEDR
jgi:hypothetical protein